MAKVKVGDLVCMYRRRSGMALRWYCDDGSTREMTPEVMEETEFAVKDCEPRSLRSLFVRGPTSRSVFDFFYTMAHVS